MASGLAACANNQSARIVKEISEVGTNRTTGLRTESFISSMGCYDENCTDSTHYHHCNVDCDHSEHYHDCAEGCAERGRKIHTEVFFRGDTLKEVVPDSITADQLLHYMVLEDCENQKRRESSAVMQLIMNR